MLMTTTQFGATPTTVQEANLTGTGQTLAEVETGLRNSFGRLASLLDLYAQNKQKAPAAFATLLEQFNTAQTAYEEAANFWLIARANTPRDQLPDPDKQPETVPKFDLTAVQFATGFAGAPTFNPANVGIVYGPWGATRRGTLTDYAAHASMRNAWGDGLGIPVVVVIFVIALVAITGAVLIAIFGKTQAAADIAANQAATAKAQARLAEVESNERTLSNLVKACIGPATDADTRLKCTTAVLTGFPEIQKGLPSGEVPGTSSRSILAIIGVLTIIGGVAGVGYMIYRRRKATSAASALPRALAYSDDDDDVFSSAAADDADEY